MSRFFYIFSRRAQLSQELNIFNALLKKKNMKLTKPRQVILEVFLQIEGYIGIEELYKRVLDEDGLIGKATVYRTMNLLLECGLAKENILSGGKRYFEKDYGKEHHDHLVCTHCGKIKEFHHKLIEKFQKVIANQHSFSITSHRMMTKPRCLVHF